MATSGSANFDATINEIIEMAGVRSGILPIDQTPSSDFYAFWRRVLNSMVKNWAAKGQQLWKVTWQEFALTASSTVLGSDSLDHEAVVTHTSSADSSDKPITGANYSKKWKLLTTTAGSAWAASTSYNAIGHLVLSSNKDIVSIEAGRFRNISNETTSPMIKMTRQEWFSKTFPPDEGEPSSFYFERKATPEIFLDPIPDSATSYILEFLVYTYPQDFDASTNNPDFLSEWIDPLVEGLMVKMGPSIGIRGGELREIKRSRDESLENATSLDVETGGFSIVPDTRRN